MATAGPTITSATRHPSDPTILQVTYTVPVSGVTRVQLWEKGPTGAPVRIVDTTTLNGSISVHSRYAAYVPVSLHMTLTHTTEGASNAGSSVNVAGFKVATPTLVSASRASATQALLTYSGLTVGFNARGYVYRSAPGGNPVQVDAFDITVSSGSRNAPAPNGTAAYEYEIRVGQHGILSDPSQRRSVEKWYQSPPAPVSFNVTRNASTGVVTGTFGAPSVTSRNRWTGIRVFRALKGQPLKAWRTLAVAARSFTDTTTVLSSDYDYGIESFNETGPSSSRPTASTSAVRDRPNAASGLSLTHMGGNVYRLNWTTSPTTERPITNQKILARVPGQTATTTLATASGTVTTHPLTLPANRIYELAVLPTNSVGDATSTSNWAGPAVSIPLAPVSLSASWLDASTVRVSWPARSTIADSWEIEFSTEANPDRSNPAHWLPGATVASSATRWDQTSASQLVPHTYRIRARHTDSGQTSAWVYSARLEGQSRPLPPTLIMPSTIDATGFITLKLRHNPVDGTAQTMAQIRHRRVGTSTWTTVNLGASSGTTLARNAYSNGDQIEVQGRTAGASGTYGDWGHITPGASMLITLRARPTATITSPTNGVALESQQVTVRWESVGQGSAELQLWSAGEQLAGATVGADVREYTFDVVLPDGAAWTAWVTPRDAWQAGESQLVGGTVAYNLPAPPTLTAEQAEAASVLLQAVPQQYLQEVRRNSLGPMREWVAVGSGSAVGAATLTLPDGSTVETATILGQATTPEFVAGGYIAAGVTAYSETGASLEIRRYEGSTPAGGAVSTVLEPGIPADVRLTASTGWAPSTFRVTVTGGEAVHVWDGIAIGQPTAGVPSDAYFDGDSVREGLVYGWLSDGVAYEAVPVSEEPLDSIPVAATVAIEIWCSETGEPGSYTRCGETGTGWDYHERHPKIGVPIWYIARAIAASGAYAESVPVPMVVESRDTFVHFGDGHLSYVTAGRLVDALTVDGGGLDVESIQYEGHAGWTHHTSDTPLAESISVDLQLLPARDASSLQEWAHALRHRDIIYREPGGIVMRGAPTMGPRRPSSRFVQRLSLTVAGEML